MNKIIYYFTFFLLVRVCLITAYAQTPCDNNEAAGFPCLGFDLQDRLSMDDLETTFVNDSWGWTDPLDGKEYALIGLMDGTAFVDISNPNEVLLLGNLPTHTSGSLWRDIKVYENYAFVVSEAPEHGMQIFDLTRLRDVVSPPIVFAADAHYDGFGSAHNIVINEDTGFAYGVGTTTFGGGPHFVNIQDPLNPKSAGGYSANDYSHDAQVVTYNGPDLDYVGREILIGSNENLVAIVDVTDKSNPVEISTVNYFSIGYTHQGWFTEDQRFFIVGDETDEVNFGFNTRTLIFDMSDLDNPILHLDYQGVNTASDHNGYVVGDLFYLASYSAGMRVIDISDIANKSIHEIGYFDTFPSSDNAGFVGIWNVYPFFKSGNIVLSGNSGFTLVKAKEVLLNNDSFTSVNDLSVFPNPAKNNINLRSNQQIGKISIYNILGQEVLVDFAGLEIELNITDLEPGFYVIKTRFGTDRIIKT